MTKAEKRWELANQFQVALASPFPGKMRISLISDRSMVFAEAASSG